MTTVANRTSSLNAARCRSCCKPVKRFGGKADFPFPGEQCATRRDDPLIVGCFELQPLPLYLFKT